MKIHGLEIDDRVARLVSAMQELPGVHTFSSCGGHAEQDICSQVAADQFYVNFDIEPTPAGWRSLELITESAQDVDDFESVRLSVWAEGGVCFELRGEHGADPDSLADRINALKGGER